jgi:hypothetical protein
LIHRQPNNSAELNSCALPRKTIQIGKGGTKDYNMDATSYIVLIKVHLRATIFQKGQRLTKAEMGASAFILLHYGLAVPVTAGVDCLPDAA